MRTHSGEDWAPGPGDEETNAEAPLKLVKAGRRVTRNYQQVRIKSCGRLTSRLFARSCQQIFAESALPPDASAVLLLSTGVPAMDVAAVEVRRSGSLNRTAMYRSSM